MENFIFCAVPNMYFHLSAASFITVSTYFSDYLLRRCKILLNGFFVTGAS